MNEIAEALTDGLIEREAAVGAVLTWAGNTYPCSGGAEAGGKKLEAGGFKVTSDVSIVVRTAVFPAGVGRPKEKQTLTYTSTPGATAVALRIESITLLHDAVMVMECEHLFAGA